MKRIFILSVLTNVRAKHVAVCTFVCFVFPMIKMEQDNIKKKLFAVLVSTIQ